MSGEQKIQLHSTTPFTLTCVFELQW